jgi:hypothetical protein
MHYGDGSKTPCRDLIPSQLRHCSDHNTTAFIARLLAAEKPDLVVFTGTCGLHALHIFAGLVSWMYDTLGFGAAHALLAS